MLLSVFDVVIEAQKLEVCIPKQSYMVERQHSNFEFEAKLYYENVSRLKYIVSEKPLNLGNKLILEQKQDISAGLSLISFT